MPSIPGGRSSTLPIGVRRAVRADGELVDRAVDPGLGVEEPAARGEVDRPGVGRGRDRVQQRRLAERADPERAEVVARRVRDEVDVADAQDPAERALPVGLRLRVDERPARLDPIRRHRAGSGLARDEPVARAERERERNRRRRRVHDRRRREPAVVPDLEDVDRARARLGRHEQLPPVRREADLAGRRQEVRRGRVAQPERARRARDRREAVRADPEALDDAGTARVEHVGQVVVDRRRSAGNWPPEGVTLSSASAWPWTRKAETVLLPAFTAISIAVVERERALRREAVGLRPRQRGAAEAAGAVRADARQVTVVAAPVDGDRVSGSARWSARTRAGGRDGGRARDAPTTSVRRRARAPWPPAAQPGSSRCFIAPPCG